LQNNININYQYSSANFNDRPSECKIDTIVIHYTEMLNAKVAIQRLCDKKAQVSAHYLISKDGEIYSLVSEQKRAWHAGESFWRGRDKVNDFSIGIELDNNGQEDFSAALMSALLTLCSDLVSKYQIRAYNVIGHSDIAPLRKQDPGIFFNWQQLADNKLGIMPIGVMPKLDLVGRNEVDIATLQEMLPRLGYKHLSSGRLDANMIAILESFCTHYLARKFQVALLPIIQEALINLLEQIEALEQK
jgi:N-acetylmuramoyl-L-alanine amidase